MKYAIAIAATALSALNASAVSAQVPERYRGVWCVSDWHSPHVHHRCRKSEIDESSFGIGRKSIELDEANENNCNAVAVKKSTKGHRLHVVCNDGLADLDLWFDALGRLHVKGEKKHFAMPLPKPRPYDPNLPYNEPGNMRAWDMLINEHRLHKAIEQTK